MTSQLPKISVAETLAEKIVVLRPGALPASTTRKCEDLLIDVVDLCVTARNEDYARSALGGWDDDGPCTVIGHTRTLTAAGAAFVNGTAAHGEDLTARNEDYARSALGGWDDDGPCTVIGHTRTLTAAGAAFVNGTAAHGEDF